MVLSKNTNREKNRGERESWTLTSLYYNLNIVWNTNKVCTLLVKNKHKQRKRETDSGSESERGVRQKGLWSKWEIKEVREWRTEEMKEQKLHLCPSSVSLLCARFILSFRYFLSVSAHQLTERELIKEQMKERHRNTQLITQNALSM